MKSKINLMLKDKFEKEITQKTITEPKTQILKDEIGNKINKKL